jgi:hypothetical protein
MLHCELSCGFLSDETASLRDEERERERVTKERRRVEVKRKIWGEA